MADFTSKYTGAQIEARLDAVSEKVDQEPGKGLSSNDFTDEYKGKLDGIDEVVTPEQMAAAVTAEGEARAEEDAALSVAIAGKQAQLVSGQNIKTINGNSILGPGNIVIQGGGGGFTPTADQEAAMNSGITSAKVSQYDGYASGKQDTISDLATIRSGAGLGATAVQPAALNAKQDVISDLATIRSGASAGATALQPSALNDYYNKTTIDGKLADKADVTALADKADKTGLATSIPASGCLPNVLYLVSITGDTAITLVGGISETSVEEFHFILSVTGSPTISWTGVQTWIGGAPDLSDGTFEVSVMAGIGVVAKIA